MEDSQVGYIFGAQSFTYLAACLLLPYTCEHSPRKLQFVIAMFGMSACLLMMGPSNLLDFPDKLWMIVTGFSIIGIFQVFVFIPIIPEMLERLQVDLNIVEGEDPALDNQLNDKVNDAYGFIFAFANFVSPLIGSNVADAFGD
jgi:MFS family permease